MNMKELIEKKIKDLEKEEKDCENGVEKLESQMEKLKEIYKMRIIQKETLKKLLIEYNKIEEDKIKEETNKPTIDLEKELEEEYARAKEQEKR